eukprot:1966422-Rhodomonas_salina.3
MLSQYRTPPSACVGGYRTRWQCRTWHRQGVRNAMVVPGMARYVGTRLWTCTEAEVGRGR